MPNAYMGKVLWVDLSSAAIWEEIVPDSIYQDFLSGLGLAAYILYREIPQKADPLGPENVLAFASGLLVGTNSLFSGRWSVAAKSPLTGTWGEANCGGTFAPAIKRCGYDGIFIRGQSDRPVYLVIENGTAELRDAAKLWGLDSVETEDHLRAAYQGSSVACIGTAGEKCALLAGICNDRGRLAARSGLGAVMGAKNLKAVVLRGNEKIRIHNTEEMQRLSQRAYAWTNFKIPLPPGWITRFVGVLFRVMPWAMAQDGILYKWMLSQWGTISMNQISVEMGDAPVQNWRGSSQTFPLSRSASTDPDRIIRKEKKKYHCRSCALGCGGIISTDTIAESHKPEYETTLSWGGMLMNEDLDSIFTLNDRLNRAGIDSISAGATAAFAIECAENNLIPPDLLDGLNLRWGNSESILRLAEQMITRQGLGDLLADGTRAAAQHLDALNTQRGRSDLPSASAFAIHAGGQELPMHDGRNDPGFALHAAVEPMPGRHTNGAQLYYEMFQLWTRVPGLPKVKRFYPKADKYQVSTHQAKASVACSRFSQVLNGAGLCLFGAFIGVSRVPVFEWLNAATGWKQKPEDYMQIGARVQAIKQLFNVRQGAALRHAIHPRAIGQPPMAHGANRSYSLDLDDMVRAYWKEAGYHSETGLPAAETLVGLRLHSLEFPYLDFETGMD
jgi:aldehyde:ferredoxin oxidoreductase